MPRVTKVLSARKAKPQYQIAVGDTYYHWSMMMGGRGVKRYSKTYPKRSQLTNSDFLGQMYDIMDDQLTVENISSADDLTTIAEDVKALGEEQTEKYDNMPDGLRDGPTGELLQERAQAMEEWAESIEQAAGNLETKLEELDGEREEHEALVAKWEEYDLATTAYDDEYAEWDAMDPEDCGDAPEEPDEPEEDRPEERDFDQERTDAIDEALGEIDEPSL